MLRHLLNDYFNTIDWNVQNVSGTLMYFKSLLYEYG